MGKVPDSSIEPSRIASPRPIPGQKTNLNDSVK